MLPNPGFDDGAFESTAFDTTLPSDPVTGVTNDRQHMEWYTCDRCGSYYPRSKMINQNGLNVCTGAGTNNCMDLPGHAAEQVKLDLPYEERPEPLPFTSEDL